MGITLVTGPEFASAAGLGWIDDKFHKATQPYPCVGEVDWLNVIFLEDGAL